MLFQAPSAPTSPSWADHVRIHDLLAIQCVSLSAQLGCLDPNIHRFARWIASTYHDEARLEGGELGDGAAVAVAAASVCVAGHLLGDPRSLESISRCVDVGEEAVRRDYGWLHGFRHEIVDVQILAHAGMELDGVYGILPSVPP